MNNNSNSSLSVSQKDLTFGRRLSMKLEVVRMSCSDMLDSETPARKQVNHTPSSSSSDPILVKRNSLAPGQLQRQKQLAADYHRRSTMTAAANFADGHNNMNSSHHSPSGSDFYPNSSDRKLIQENITATRQIMDLKLQVADLLTKNDTLDHENRLLTDANSRLETDCTDIKSDLVKAYERISRLKKERDEAVRDLTRARMLQIREDSRRTKLLGNVANAEEIRQQAKKEGSTTNMTTGSSRSHASSSTSSIAKGSSTSSNLSSASGWFRRWNHHRQEPGESSPPSTKSKVSSNAAVSNSNTAQVPPRGVLTFLAAIDDTNATSSEDQVVLPGRRASDTQSKQDWGTTGTTQAQAPVLIRRSRVVGEEHSEPISNNDKREKRALERKDTENDVDAFFSSFTRNSSDSLSLYDDDENSIDNSSDKNDREAFTRSQSRLPSDAYHQHYHTNENGRKQNAIWDDVACDVSDDNSIDRDESFVFKTMRDKQITNHDSQSLLMTSKRTLLDSSENITEGGLETLPHRRSLNACEA